jgi:hypothetical protein
MAGKRSLADLMAPATVAPTPEPLAVQESESQGVVESVTPEVAPAAAAEAEYVPPPIRSTRVPRRTSKAKPQGSGPMYARLEAKEARLRPDQRDELGVLARRLERARQAARSEGATERITDNTLIRVAIDVLLEAGVEGLTEEQLRESLRAKVGA